MKTDCISIVIPAEGPEIPQGWKFLGYSVRDESFSEIWPEDKVHDPRDLASAGRCYAQNGEETHSLVAECEHCTADGCHSIYCQFEPDDSPSASGYKWGKWIDWGDGREFDFSSL